MFDKLITVEQRYDELLQLLGTAQVQSDSSEFRKLSKDRKSTRLNSSHIQKSRMPSSA